MADAYFNRLDHYKILKLDTPDFPGRVELPEDYAYSASIDTDDEVALLQPEFPGWRQPVSRSMPGAREDGVVCVTHAGRPVAVCYVTDDNQLGLAGYGELHYAAVDPDHRGRGLWRAMITELFSRAAGWGVAGVIFVTDRAGPIEMYLRLGAVEVAIRPKPAPPPPWRRLLRRARGLARPLLARDRPSPPSPGRES